MLIYFVEIGSDSFTIKEFYSGLYIGEASSKIPNWENHGESGNAVSDCESADED